MLLGRQLAKPRSTKVETAKAVVRGRRRNRVAAPLPITPIVEPEKEAHAQYAGSQSCKACHAELFAQWEMSNHGMAERPLRDDLDKTAFDPAKTVAHGTQTLRGEDRGGKTCHRDAGIGEQGRASTIERAIGHDPLRQYLVKAFGGRLQTLELAFDPHKEDWFDIYGNEDRKPGEWGHWTGRGMTWNTMCASCHNTRVRKNYDEKTDSFHTTMAEMTVSCESCHGPMKKHVEWRAQYPDKALADPTITKFTPDQKFDTCGTCHSRRTELTGDFKPGDHFYDHHMLATVDETDLYYPDGQVRDEDYEFGSFLSSKMHAAGVRCLDCHNPHTAKTIATGDALCMRCHVGNVQPFPKAPVIDILTHTFHQPESTGVTVHRTATCRRPSTCSGIRGTTMGSPSPIPCSRRNWAFPMPATAATRTRTSTGPLPRWRNGTARRWSGPRASGRASSRRRGAVRPRRAMDCSNLLKSETETGYWKAVGVADARSVDR